MCAASYIIYEEKASFKAHYEEDDLATKIKTNENDDETMTRIKQRDDYNSCPNDRRSSNA